MLFVGPAPLARGGQNPGGQLTAAQSILKFASNLGIQVDVVNTVKQNFPLPTRLTTLRQGFARCLQVLKRVFAKDRPDAAIIFTGAHASFFERSAQAVLCRLRGVRSMILIRDGYFTAWMGARPLTNKLLVRLLCVPNYVLVQGEGIRQDMIALGASSGNLHVVPNWLPPQFEITSKPKRKSANEPLRLVYVGWLIKEKGILDFCEAIDLILANGVTGDELIVDIIGGGTLEAELRERYSAADASGSLKSCIHLHGWKTHAEILPMLDLAHVFVLPSHGEGFPNALLEASARGLPAICTRVGAVPDTVIDGVNGFLVDRFDAPAVALAVTHYLRTPDLIECHSVAMLEAVARRHDWQRNLASLFDHFQATQ